MDMDELGGHYVELNKPGTEGQALNGCTHMWNLKIKKKKRFYKIDSFSK